LCCRFFPFSRCAAVALSCAAVSSRLLSAHATLEPWGRSSAFNVQKVLWLIDELQLPFAHTRAGGAAGGLDTPQFRALNPHGRVPVLREGATVVWESHSIPRYLAASYGNGASWSTSAAERSLPNARWRSAGWTGRKPVCNRNSRRCSGIITACRRHGAMLPRSVPWPRAAPPASQRLRGNWSTRLISPARPSPWPTFPPAPRYIAISLFRDGVPGAAVPRVRAWYARLAARAAYRARVMQRFGELRGRTDF
jgi:glutathione S-transferase